MMGVGKSTIGKILAKKLKFGLFDTDKLIEKKNLMNFKLWKFPEVLKVNKYGIPEPDLFK